MSGVSVKITLKICHKYSYFIIIIAYTLHIHINCKYYTLLYVLSVVIILSLICYNIFGRTLHIVKRRFNNKKKQKKESGRKLRGTHCSFHCYSFNRFERKLNNYIHMLCFSSI